MRESAPANGSVIFAARSGAARLVSSGAEFPPGQAGFDSDRDVYVDSTSTRTFQVYDLDKVSAPRFTGSKVKLQPAPFPLQSLGCIAIKRLCLSDCLQSGRLIRQLLLPSRAAGVGLN